MRAKSMLAAVLLTVTFALAGAAAAADVSGQCLKDLPGGDETASDGESTSREWVKEQQNQNGGLAAQLSFCATAAPVYGPGNVIANCGCQEAVYELCSWGWDDGKFEMKGPGGCDAFIPALK